MMAYAAIRLSARLNPRIITLFVFAISLLCSPSAIADCRQQIFRVDIAQGGRAIDAALMPFSIVIGHNIAASTRDVVFVHPGTLQRIVDVISARQDLSQDFLASNKKSFEPTFLALMYGPHACVGREDISDRQLSHIAALLDAGFRRDMVSTPPWIVAIENM